MGGGAGMWVDKGESRWRWVDSLIEDGTDRIRSTNQGVTFSHSSVG